MPIKKVKLITTHDHATRRLDEILTDFLPEALGRPVSKTKVRKLIMAGAIHLNGRPLRIASKTLSPGATIEAHIDVARLFEDSTSRDKTFELTIDRILFEDDDLIVVDKPACFPSQPTVDQVRDNLFAAVNRLLARREGVPKTYVGAHQRLDRDTSGVVLFTKSQRVNAAVSEIFSKHQGIKIYQALTMPRRNSRSASIKKEWNVRNHLGKI